MGHCSARTRSGTLGRAYGEVNRRGRSTRAALRMQRGFSMSGKSAVEAERFRAVFRAAHAAHARCASDEWLHEPCADSSGGAAPRPLVWSRRNGPWRRSDVLWVGAAPGNAGGLGSGALGAHATRIPFGGDIAGGNLDVLLSAIGSSRNDTFIVAALNQLPERGGGEPTTRELAAAVGDYPDSIALLHDTIVATGPRLIVALGNVALRVTAAALTRQPARVSERAPGRTSSRAAARAAPSADGRGRAAAALRLPTSARLAAAGFVRGVAHAWPGSEFPFGALLRDAWHSAWGEQPQLTVLPLLHPSAQNMSPFAGTHTQFHQRMRDTLAALRHAVHDVLGMVPPAERPPLPTDGIYALPEWRRLVAPAHRRYDELWRERGV
jgi:uracil-DNA glycosylase